MTMGRDPRSASMAWLGDDSEGFLAQLQDAVRTFESMTPAPSFATDGFTDRVMVAIAREPLPRRSAPLRWLTAVLAPFVAIRDAWDVSMTKGRPLGVRLQAFALVLVVAFAVGSAGALAAYGAGRWLGGDRRDGAVAAPSAPSAPLATHGVVTLDESPLPTPEETRQSEQPTVPSVRGLGGAPGAAGTPPHQVRRPTRTPAPVSTDDHGGSGGAGGSGGGDGGDSGGSPTDDPGSDGSGSGSGGSDSGSSGLSGS